MSAVHFPTRYCFDGLSIALSGVPTGLAAAVHARLHRLVANGEGPAELTLALYENGDGTHTAARPAGPARPVLDLLGGDGVYLTDEDLFHVQYTGRTRATCAAGQGLAEIAVADTQPANVRLAAHPILTFALSELLKRRGRYSIHAAGLSLNGKAIILAGRSGSGKSTLAAALLRAGFGFLGGDTLFLRWDQGSLRVLGFPDGVDLGEESLRFFPELRHLLAPPGGAAHAKRQVDVEAIYGAVPLRSCRPAVLVLTQIAADGRTALAPLDPGAALLALAPNVLLTEARSSQAHLDALAALARESVCYRLAAGRDFDEIAALLRRLVE